MSNIAASVSNETRDRSIPHADRSPMDLRNNENTPNQEQQPNSAQLQGSSGSNNNQIRAKSIGNYILGKTLGEGTFGKVKLGTHILTGEKVAIKVLEKDRIIDVADVERVAREIYILKFIRHPNIVQLYEIIETPKQLFLVTEYINGGELFDYIVAKTRVEEREASKFFHQIIAGIEYIHKLKIVHRDLKPENLLLDCNNNIKIVDFGLSNTYGEGELLKTACGSPCYAAPEMIGGKKYHGLQVDIWSCGVILFAIVCGYLPFEDPNTNVLYTKIKNGDYTIPDFISEEGKDLMKNILNTDPTKRYTIEDIRKHPWMNKIELSKKSEGIIVGYHQTPIDMDILKQLDQYGFQFDFAQKCLDANKHNHVTTTYYLLLRKYYQGGGMSPADINSDTFDKTLLMPKTAQPKVNNYYSICNEIEGEKENEKKERDRSRKKSADHSQNFMLSEVNLKQRQSKEIAKIYGSLLDSSSRDRVPTSSYSSKGSRILKDTSLLDNTTEYKRKSITGKRISSPARADARDEKATKAPEEVFTPSQNYASNNPPRHAQPLNKSFNNSTLKERLKEIYKMGGDKGSKSKQSRGDSYDESHGPVHQSMNQDLFNESFKVDMKDVNNSFMCQLQPKLHRNSVKNTRKPAVNSIQSTPKKGPKGSQQLEERAHPGLPRDARIGQRTTGSVNPNEKSKTHSQSPSKINPMMPKEPGYSKPRDSSVNALRSKVQSRKNSRPAIQMAANGKAWRPSTNQAASRERGRSTGLGDDSFKASGNNETSFNIGSASFMLNSSFQKNMLDRSFDYHSHQPKVNVMNLNKRVSYGGEGQNKRGRSNNFSPTNIHKKNLQNLLNKSGCVKC